MAGKFRGLTNQTRMECTLECTFSPRIFSCRHDVVMTTRDKKEKKYLEANFNVSQVTGRKVNTVIVAKDMRPARDEGREKLFSSSDFFKSFSRLTAKRRQQLYVQ